MERDEGGWLRVRRLGGGGATGWIPTAYIEEATEADDDDDGYLPVDGLDHVEHGDNSVGCPDFGFIHGSFRGIDLSGLFGLS